MINNFSVFPRHFVPGEYYFIQILNRKIAGSSNKNRCIKTYYIDTEEYLSKKIPEMIDIATATTSRIYIHPARRSGKAITLGTIGLLLEYIKNDDFAGLPRVLDSASGKDLGVERLRVVDVDEKEKLDEAVAYIKTLRPLRDPEYILPTVKGRHIIVRPFDLSERNLPRDIQKNNPTLLFALM